LIFAKMTAKKNLSPQARMVPINFSEFLVFFQQEFICNSLKSGESKLFPACFAYNLVTYLKEQPILSGCFFEEHFTDN